MAALNKIDLTGHIFGTHNVPQKPPLPSRPVSGKFLNRGSGKLFPSTRQNILFNDSKTQCQQEFNVNELAVVLHKNARIDNENSQPSTPKSVPSYCKRTQSAKAKTKRKDEVKFQRQRPQSAGTYFKNKQNDSPGMCSNTAAVIDLADKVIPSLFEIERDKLLALPEPKNHDVYHDMPPMHFSRPSSAKSDFENDSLCSYKKRSAKASKESDLKPSIYGLQRQRQYFGSVPDLNSANCNFEQFPYKTSEGVTDTNNSLPSPKSRDIPSSLEPLLPWLQEDVPEDVIGVNSADCLVFLAPTDWEDLPEVPTMPPGDDEDLPFVTDITSPKPWNPKKYPHYFSKPVEDWVCRHGAQLDGEEDTEGQTIYRATLRLPRMRSAEVIKKEISDLENLLIGIGTKDSDCGMVQYQSEISCFQNLLNDTLEMVPERLKNRPLKSPRDRFGLKQMFEEHDITIQNIRERVQECRTELADLELEAGIDTARQYFRKRSNSVL